MKHRLASIGCLLVTIALLGLAVGCGPVEESNPDAAADLDAEDAVNPDRLCMPPAVTQGRPETIEDIVRHINALPKPVTVPCFLESLQRPLTLYATGHRFSAQPPPSASSPRIFIFNGKLSMSIVTSGLGSHLLEMGIQTSDDMSLKGEIAFPVDEDLPFSAPYDQILMDEDGTKCRFCHLNETYVDSVTAGRAYISEYIPGIPEERVSIEQLKQLHDTCDPVDDPYRCSMFEALLGHGDIVDGEL